MKKGILFVLLTISLLSVNAQSVQFGIKTGINFATLRGENLANADASSGIHIGGLAELKFTDKFSVQPEILFSQLGTESGEEKLRLDYIALPIMAKYYLLEGFSVSAGPQVAFLIYDQFTTPAVSLNPNIEDVDFGLNFGFGYNFKSGMFFSTRYSLGITAVQENPDLKNGNFQLSLGYQF